MSNQSQSKPTILMYTAEWCGDCKRSKHWLEENGFASGKDYLEIDIESSPKAAEKVTELNNGNRSIPTFVFPDGSTLTEPSNQELSQKMNSLQIS